MKIVTRLPNEVFSTTTGRYKAVENISLTDSCVGCCFDNGSECLKPARCRTTFGYCRADDRKDGKNIIYKIV